MKNVAAPPTPPAIDHTAARRALMLDGHSARDASMRLQSGAVARGLASMPGWTCELVAPEIGVLDGAPVDCIGFHYHDVRAVEFLRHHRHTMPQALVACFGADIRDFERYADLHAFVDFYVVPTEWHRMVLAGGVNRPVFAVTEPVDPIAIEPGQPVPFPPKQGRRVGWFGYAASFYPGMLSLLPVLQQHAQRGGIDSFELITDPDRFPNDHGLRVRRFASGTLARDLRALDYVVISHLPLDLGINSLIKSPNKALTALVAGAIPLASATPSYSALFEELGLQRFLFDSPAGLHDLLGRLDPAADSQLLRDSRVAERLRETYTDERTAAAFAAVFAAVFATASASVRGSVLQGSSGAWSATGGSAAPLTYQRFSTERMRLGTRLQRAVRARTPSWFGKGNDGNKGKSGAD
jgi:hypothetical protein